MSALDKDTTAADSSTTETPSKAISTGPEAVIEDTAGATTASPAAIAGAPADREATTQGLSRDDRSRAHEQEIERLKQLLREHNERLEATTQMLSAMRPTGLEPPGAVPPQAEELSRAEAPSLAPLPAAEQKPTGAALHNPSPSSQPSGEATRAAVGIPTSEELGRVHNDEMERLKERLREQDIRLDATTRLLSAIRLPEPVAPSPAPTPVSRTPHYAILGAAAALAIVAGFLYLRSQTGPPAGQKESLALGQTQPAASAPSTAPQLASQMPVPGHVAVPAVVPPQLASAQPPVAGTQALPAPAASLQAPVAQAPTTQAKAEPPPLPEAALPLPEQGPPSAERPPDEAPPPETVPVPRPVVDDALSRDLTNYLHHHKLPFVDATVYAKAGTPSSLSLSGEVRTAIGKDDGATKAREFLGNRSLKVHNRVRINPELASNPQPGADAGAPVAGSPPASAANSCTDLCQKDDGHCEVHCHDQSIGSATGLGGSIGSWLNQLGQAGAQARDCIEDCHQTEEHCATGCSSGGSDHQSSGPPGGGEPAEQGPSGPDQPPE